jgi:hypothetical protein
MGEIDGRAISDSRLVLDKDGTDIDSDKLLEEEVSKKSNSLMILLSGEKWTPGKICKRLNE